MPKKQTKRKILKYDHDKMVQAVEAVKSGAMSIRAAAAKYEVPKSTLGDKISGRSDLETNIGRRPALSQVVEDKLVDNVLEASKRGMGISRKQLFARTAIVCRRMRVTPFKHEAPGRGWWSGLKKRHPEMTIRKPEKLGNSRARMLNSTVVSKYMTDLGKLITKLQLHDKPNLIWNCDETGKQFQHTPVKVISQKGAKNVVSRVSENRTNITIMACVSGSGQKMVPMVIVKGKTSASLHGLNVSEAPEGTVFAYQENGWMTEDLGERWFQDIFLKQCGPERPQLLLLDGHSSHETLGLLELAVKENIQILCLPPHTTHMLQPLDRTVFGPFNSAYNTACSQFLAESPYHAINKGSFPSLLRKAWDRGVTSENIINGFKACGIVPFDPQAIPAAAYHPAVATEKPLPSSEPEISAAIAGRNVLNDAAALCPTSSAEFVKPHSPIATPVRSPSLSVFTSPKSPIHATSLSVSSSSIHSVSLPVSSSPIPTSQSVCSSQLHTASPPFDLSLSGKHLVAIPDTDMNENFELDDPETLLGMLLSDKIELVTADSNGIANFTATETTTKPTAVSFGTETATDSSVWNNALDSIFLPSNVPKENIQPTKKSRAKTTHRLLTAEDVLAEKREILKKKEQKQLKSVKKPKMEK